MRVSCGARSPPAARRTRHTRTPPHRAHRATARPTPKTRTPTTRASSWSVAQTEPPPCVHTDPLRTAHYPPRALRRHAPQHLQARPEHEYGAQTTAKTPPTREPPRPPPRLSRHTRSSPCTPTTPKTPKTRASSSSDAAVRTRLPTTRPEPEIAHDTQDQDAPTARDAYHGSSLRAQTRTTAACRDASSAELVRRAHTTAHCAPPPDTRHASTRAGSRTTPNPYLGAYGIAHARRPPHSTTRGGRVSLPHTHDSWTLTPCPRRGR
ncbi:hypothetical protein B0H17DRAFT_699812 [Mycena rosella]|uniref:Uncharacterized protein n=1 Tax=Mycena rosella TaxID=1033263 RepID=A0AAD7DCE2_MYCRO|nr:hypothetical protein B0H17DRAFT_699812 [Mycena rosella]